MKELQHGRIKIDEANAFVGALHRHHPQVVGHLFSIGAFIGERLVGVVIVGRPVSRMRDDGLTAEVTRLCTDGTRNACSFLYGRAARAAFALGFLRIGTYTLPDGSNLNYHGGWWNGYKTFFFRDLKNHNAIIVLSNREHSGFRELDGLVDIIYDRKPDAKRKYSVYMHHSPGY